MSNLTLYGSEGNPFDYRDYYNRTTNIDIGTVAYELLNDRITEKQDSILYVDCPHHASVSHRSFVIWLNGQGWYCHGCGVGGDVLQLVEFVQSGQVTRGRVGKMPESHRNARDWIANKLGLPPLGQLGLSAEEIRKVEQARALTLRAWECLTETAKFYHQQLLANDKALNWIREKYAFDKKILEDFLIGYADNTGLVKHLTDAGFSLRELTASGAFRPNSQVDEIVHPVFEGRIIFPYLSKGRAVFMIARKTPWTPDNQFEAGKYKKLPVHDQKNRPWVAEGIDNGSLFNEDILTARPDYVIITEGITDCISLICRGFPAVSPVTVNIRGNDWERIIPKLRGVKQVILCQDNEISEAGWKGALRSANRLAKEKISCRVTQLPLGEKEEQARQQLEKHGIRPGIEPKQLKEIQEQKSLKELKEIEECLETAKIDVCSYFVSGKTAADFQALIDGALLPVEFAIQSVPDNLEGTQRTTLLNDILTEIGRQPKLEQEQLLKTLQKKSGEGLTTLRTGMKEALAAVNLQKREEACRRAERNLGPPVFQRGNRSFYLVDNAIVEQHVRDTPDGPLVSSQEVANFHVRITEEEITDDGYFQEDGRGVVQKTLFGEIISKDWKKPFRIEAQEWGSNNKLAGRISEQAGAQALFSTQDMDTVRLVSSVASGIPKQKTVYSIFGVHPTAGFVSPTLTINQGKIKPTAETETIVNVGGDYAKAQRLDLAAATDKEIKSIVNHLLTTYLELQPHQFTLPILAHAFVGPLLFGMNLAGEFPPYILFLVGSSGRGKTETAKFAQSIWGDFQVKEHMASWGSTPEINRQEGARCRGALWVIDDFKRQKIGQSQWNNAIRVLLDYADLQARKRATPGSKVITGHPMKCMLLVTGEDVPASETALLARSLLINFEGEKKMEIFRQCLDQQENYRKIPGPYIAWLQQQDRPHWLKQIREYLDCFTNWIDAENLTSDNSRRLASNAALSAIGLRAFLEFAKSVKVITRDTLDILMLDHWEILTAILRNMLLEVDEIKPVNCFLFTFKELFQSKRIKILDNVNESSNDRGVTVVGYKRPGDSKFVYILPTTIMGIVREHFYRGHGESLQHSNAAIGKQLEEEGYICRTESDRITSKVRLPGAGRKATSVRVWKFDAGKLEELLEQSIHDSEIS